MNSVAFQLFTHDCITISCWEEIIALVIIISVNVPSLLCWMRTHTHTHITLELSTWSTVSTSSMHIHELVLRDTCMEEQTTNTFSHAIPCIYLYSHRRVDKLLQKHMVSVSTVARVAASNGALCCSFFLFTNWK